MDSHSIDSEDRLLLEELQGRLSSRDPRVRWEAVKSAVSGEQFELLIACLVSEKNWKVLEACIIGLGNASGDRTVEALGKFLCDRKQEKNLRALAATTLGKMKQETALPYLLAVQDDRSYAVRVDAAEALVKLGFDVRGRNFDEKSPSPE